jgi:hypothetical protein
MRERSNAHKPNSQVNRMNGRPRANHHHFHFVDGEVHANHCQPRKTEKELMTKNVDARPGQWMQPNPTQWLDDGDLWHMPDWTAIPLWEAWPALPGAPCRSLFCKEHRGWGRLPRPLNPKPKP